MVNYTNSNTYQRDGMQLQSVNTTVTAFNNLETILSAPGSGLSYYIWGWNIVTDSSVLHTGALRGGTSTNIAFFGATTGSPSLMKLPMPIKVGDNKSLQVIFSAPSTNVNCLLAIYYVLAPA